jgi:hypothetical protein
MPETFDRVPVDDETGDRRRIDSGERRVIREQLVLAAECHTPAPDRRGFRRRFFDALKRLLQSNKPRVR